MKSARHRSHCSAYMLPQMEDRRNPIARWLPPFKRLQIWMESVCNLAHDDDFACSMPQTALLELPLEPFGRGKNRKFLPSLVPHEVDPIFETAIGRS
jgi:hypothetical protein